MPGEDHGQHGCQTDASLPRTSAKFSSLMGQTHQAQPNHRIIESRSGWHLQRSSSPTPYLRQDRSDPKHPIQLQIPNISVKFQSTLTQHKTSYANLPQVKQDCGGQQITVEKFVNICSRDPRERPHFPLQRKAKPLSLYQSVHAVKFISDPR